MQPGNVQPWWIRYGLVLFQEGRDFDSLAVLRRLQSKFEGVGEVRTILSMYSLRYVNLLREELHHKYSVGIFVGLKTFFSCCCFVSKFTVHMTQAGTSRAYCGPVRTRGDQGRGAGMERH